MTCKHVMWFISIVVAVVAMAAGVAVLVNRFIVNKKDDDDYEFIECGDDSAEDCKPCEESGKAEDAE